MHYDYDDVQFFQAFNFQGGSCVSVFQQEGGGPVFCCVSRGETKRRRTAGGVELWAWMDIA